MPFVYRKVCICVTYGRPSPWNDVAGSLIEFEKLEINFEITADNTLAVASLYIPTFETIGNIKISRLLWANIHHDGMPARDCSVCTRKNDAEIFKVLPDTVRITIPHAP